MVCKSNNKSKSVGTLVAVYRVNEPNFSITFIRYTRGAFIESTDGNINTMHYPYGLSVFHDGVGLCANISLSENTVYLFPQVLLTNGKPLFDHNSFFVEGRVMTKVYLDTNNIKR